MNISNTSVSGFGGDGIRLHGSSHTVSACTVAGVGGVGINILDDSQVRPVPANVQCTNNTVSDARGRGCGWRARTARFGQPHPALRRGHPGAFGPVRCIGHESIPPAT
ncbi:right-handed parallel beta-helix repeat-containing protein [bacterium]|nr:right-handed parallel beta-helix repeat-containing protein [bacterium]